MFDRKRNKLKFNHGTIHVSIYFVLFLKFRFVVVKKNRILVDNKPKRRHLQNAGR